LMAALSFVPALASTAPARADVECPLVPSLSSYSVDGQSTLGAIVNSVGGPVHVDGSCVLEFTPGPGNQLMIKVAALEMITVDDVHLSVVCAPPMPPPATIAIEDLEIFLDSNGFVRGPGGQVDLQVYGDVVGGHLTVTLLGGAVLHQDLAGTGIVATARTGALTSGQAGGGVELDLPLEFELSCGDVGQQLGMNVHLDGRVLARRQYPAPTTYCVGKVNSVGCTGAIDAQGFPSVTAGNGYIVRCQQVRNQTAGLLFYGTSGRASLPFHGGTLCVDPPLTRTLPQPSGGSASGVDCTGTFAFDFNTWIATQPPSSPVRLPGTEVNCQWWSRDPGVESTTVFSNALEFTIGL
jgi:hypothetical protein